MSQELHITVMFYYCENTSMKNEMHRGFVTANMISNTSVYAHVILLFLLSLPDPAVNTLFFLLRLLPTAFLYWPASNETSFQLNLL